ncbi:hypothetical protein CEXT_656481 [Caerostris extrusa]|uniref:Uncharacterized protein n=1 Tax=Caerostris extrusa TaxID=172846 RepID=A0AAV4UGC3_CAEEX|nr:hypothetical protein CEXT_656481 [Caerostris extrusa]
MAHKVAALNFHNCPSYYKKKKKKNEFKKRIPKIEGVLSSGVWMEGCKTPSFSIRREAIIAAARHASHKRCSKTEKEGSRNGEIGNLLALRFRHAGEISIGPRVDLICL